MSRARHEHQIGLHKTTFGNEFINALITAINRNGGLSWFSDEQIADIRAEMIEWDWSRHKLNRENRRRAA